VRRVFENLKAVAEAAGSDLARVVKLNVYLTDLAHFALVNRVMAEYCPSPTRRAPRSVSRPCRRAPPSRSTPCSSAEPAVSRS